MENLNNSTKPVDSGSTKKILRRGSKTQNVFALCDDIYFTDVNLQKVGQVIHPVMAGITHPDPRYFCKRGEKDPYAPHLYVLEYVVAGKGTIEVEGKKYHVRAGDFYMLNRCTIPYYYSDQNDPMEKKWVNIAGRFLNALCYTYAINEPVLVVHMDAELHLDRIHEILSSYDFQNSDADNYELMEVLLSLFDMIHISRRSSPEKPERAVFDQILEYITSNITFDRLSPPMISSYFYISYRTLNRMFIKNLGIPPGKYIAAQKIEYAKQLLLTTGNTIERIAEILNFSSPQHFRTVFISYCGISPTKWRRENRK